MYNILYIHIQTYRKGKRWARGRRAKLRVYVGGEWSKSFRRMSPSPGGTARAGQLWRCNGALLGNNIACRTFQYTLRRRRRHRYPLYPPPVPTILPPPPFNHYIYYYFYPLKTHSERAYIAVTPYPPSRSFQTQTHAHTNLTINGMRSRYIILLILQVLVIHVWWVLSSVCPIYR